MIKVLRKKIFLKILFSLIIVSFVIGSVMTTNREYAGKIFNKKISMSEYRKSYIAVRNRAIMQYGDQFTKMQKYLNLDNQAWERLILLYYAKKNGINVKSRKVIDTIASLPFFQKEGIFDKESYNFIIKNVFGLTARDYEEYMRQDLIIADIVNSVQDKITISDKDVHNSYKWKNEKSDISYIIIDNEVFKNDVLINNSELEPFFKSRKEQFLTPRKIDVLYVKIDFPEQIKEEPESAEEETDKNDDTDKEDKPKESEEKIEARYIANEINNALSAGQDFLELSKRHGLTLKQTGPLAFGEEIPEIGTSYPFSIIAFNLSQENSNNIVEEKDAFYVLKLSRIHEPAIPKFKEVRDQVREALINHKAEIMTRDTAKKYFDILKNGEDTLENLAQTVQLEIKTQQDITRESYVDGAGFNPDFTKACFFVEENEFAGPIKIEKGFAILRTDKFTPIDEDAFEKEKEEYKQELLENRKNKEFSTWLKRLKEKANPKINI